MLSIASVPQDRLVDAVERAIDLQVPAIQMWMGLGLTEHRQACSIVVAHCGIPWSEEAIIAEHDVNNPDPEKREIARSKAEISHRLNRPTCDVPLLWRSPGDTQYWGSAVAPHIGLVVAISGLQPWFDELGSWQIEAATVALLKNDGLIKRGPNWDPGLPAFLTEKLLEQMRSGAVQVP